MNLKWLKQHFLVPVLLVVAFLLLACGGEVVNGDNNECPENVVCDTSYVNTRAYSFIYFSEKNKLDTITATTDKMSCNIWKDYFECTLKKTYSTCNVVAVSSEKSDKSKGGDSLKHIKVEVKRGDTTYINYGKNRLMNYIPPYVEIPPFDAKKLKAAFDTVIVKPTSYKSEKLTGESRMYVDAYYIEYSGLPDWAYISKTSGQLLVLDGADGTRNADTTFISDGLYLVELACSKTVYIDYPQKLVAYQSYVNVYADSTELPRKDTTVKWMAHYTDMYGVEDSLQVKTLFRINRKK